MTKQVVAFRNFANAPKNMERYGAKLERLPFELTACADYLKSGVTLVAMRLTPTASPFYSVKSSST
jgi:hypothetical protein